MPKSDKDGIMKHIAHIREWGNYFVVPITQVEVVR